MYKSIVAHHFQNHLWCIFISNLAHKQDPLTCPPVQHKTSLKDVGKLNHLCVTTAKIVCFGGYFVCFQSNYVLCIEPVSYSPSSFVFLQKRKNYQKDQPKQGGKAINTNIKFKNSIFVSWMSPQGAKYGLLPFWVFMFSHKTATRSTLYRIKALKIKQIFFFFKNNLHSWPYEILNKMAMFKYFST